MTSRWSSLAPACSKARTSSANRPKSQLKSDGAIRGASRCKPCSNARAFIAVAAKGQAAQAMSCEKVPADRFLFQAVLASPKPSTHSGLHGSYWRIARHPKVLEPIAEWARGTFLEMAVPCLMLQGRRPWWEKIERRPNPRATRPQNSLPRLRAPSRHLRPTWQPAGSPRCDTTCRVKSPDRSRHETAIRAPGSKQREGSCAAIRERGDRPPASRCPPCGWSTPTRCRTSPRPSPDCPR